MKLLLFYSLFFTVSFTTFGSNKCANTTNNFLNSSVEKRKDLAYYASLNPCIGKEREELERIIRKLENGPSSPAKKKLLQTLKKKLPMVSTIHYPDGRAVTTFTYGNDNDH